VFNAHVSANKTSGKILRASDWHPSGMFVAVTGNRGDLRRLWPRSMTELLPYAIGWPINQRTVCVVLSSDTTQPIESNTIQRRRFYKEFVMVKIRLPPSSIMNSLALAKVHRDDAPGRGDLARNLLVLCVFAQKLARHTLRRAALSLIQNDMIDITMHTRDGNERPPPQSELIRVALSNASNS